MKFIIFTLISLIMSVSYGKMPIKIAVIDSGFSGLYATPRARKSLCKSGHYDFTTNTVNVGFDIIGHGTFITNLIVENARSINFCVIVFKVNVYDVKIGNRHITHAIVKAHKLGVKAINISLGVPIYSHRQKRVMKAAARRGMKIFISAGNQGRDLNHWCMTFPACYASSGKNIYVVGAVDQRGLIETYSNRGALVHIYEYGSIMGIGRGTSFAAPRALARYLREKR